MNKRVYAEFKAEMNGTTVIGRIYQTSHNYGNLVIAAYAGELRLKVIREGATIGYFGRVKLLKLATELLLTYP